MLWNYAWNGLEGENVNIHNNNEQGISVVMTWSYTEIPILEEKDIQKI